MKGMRTPTTEAGKGRMHTRVEAFSVLGADLHKRLAGSSYTLRRDTETSIARHAASMRGV